MPDQDDKLAQEQQQIMAETQEDPAAVEGSSDGRGRVTNPETDQRVGNKSGNMGKSFRDNRQLASEAGRKGGEHSGGAGRQQGSNSRQLSQKEAVYNAITRVLGTEEFEGNVELSSDQRHQAREILHQQFKNGEIVYAGNLPDDKTLFTYTGGLISNWVRKDSRLNGGEKYMPKNPGVRAGSGDEQLKAMRALLAQTQDPNGRADIQKAIDERLAELKPKREINVEALPDHLKRYVHQ